MIGEKIPSVDELYELAIDLFKSQGYTISKGSDSKTSFGHSRYFYINYEGRSDENSGLGLKVRVSDHSVQNFDRMFNEIHLNTKTAPLGMALLKADQKLKPEFFRKEMQPYDHYVTMEVNEKGYKPETDEILSQRLSSAKRGAGRTIYNIKRTTRREEEVLIDIRKEKKMEPQKSEAEILAEIETKIKESCNTSRYNNLCMRTQTPAGLAYVVNRCITMMAKDKINLSAALANLEAEEEGID
jgi:hypothetical protein